MGGRRRQAVIGKPDFIFRREKVAVFVDGCFWHGCPRHGSLPASNQLFWKKKLKRNRQRDATVKKALIRLGWTVLRFWEHDLQKPEKCVSRILRFVNLAPKRLKSRQK